MVGDLASGEGVEAAAKGVDTIAHLAGTAKGDAQKAAHLVEAASAAGRPYVVNISVVGADRVPVHSRVDRAMFGYYASKLGAERVVEGSGLPWTTLRATQFHELLLTMVEASAKLPITPVLSGFRFQPIAASEVADRLVELTGEGPAGLVDEMGGPTIHELKELMRDYLSATGKRRLTVPVGAVGGAAKAMRAGANLTPEHAVGRQDWREFLAERFGAGEER